MKWGWIAAAGIAGVFVGAKLFRATDSYCCQQFAKGARDTIANALGPFSGVVSSGLDATGATNLLPGVLQDLGYNG